MSSDSMGDQRMDRMDKNEDQWTSFLKGHGLTVNIEVVKKVADWVVHEMPLYRLYDSKRKPALAGKGTVYKIKGLIEAGKLDPFLEHLGLRKPAEGEPSQIIHLRTLKTFLEDPRFHNSFFIETPDSIIEQMAPLVGNHSVDGVRHLGWESLPIISRIRDHLPEHQLWEQIEEWKRREVEYRGSIYDIPRKLRAEFREGLAFPVSEIASPEQEHLLMLDIVDWLTAQPLGRVPRHHRLALCISHEIDENLEPFFVLTCDDTCYAMGTKAQLDFARGVVYDMTKRWSDSDDIRSVVHQYYYLQVLSQRIRDEIQKIDEAVLGQETCRDCPMLRGSSNAKLGSTGPKDAKLGLGKI